MELNINLENCYGIKKLDMKFNFNVNNTFAIYAPNGSMKTSFAKTFLDLSDNYKKSEDLINPERNTLRIIKDENDKDLDCNSIFVIKSYDEDYASKKVSTLLANPKLRKKYELIVFDITKLKQRFLKELKDISKSRKNIEDELYKVFNENEFVGVFKKIKSLICDVDYNFSNLNYDLFFNDKAFDFLKTSGFKLKLKEYIEIYDSLLKNSRFLKNGFNHYKANKISKELSKDSFFNAKHSLNLFDAKTNKNIEVKSIINFDDIIEKEKNLILSSNELKLKFKSIDSKIKNQELEELREFLKENKEIIIELNDLVNFAQKIWVSYIINNNKELFEELFIKAEKDIKNILIEVKKEQKDWKEVISEFNKRFFVPFKIKIKNIEDIVLKGETIPFFEYEFKDKDNNTNTSKSELMTVLSSGEKKALYLLNIIFEVKARDKLSQKTIFIIDDIADSFDYKNKYAIIQYLKEIAENSHFYQIILTHNFDFFRTIQSRFVSYKNCLIASKDNSKIKLISSKYIKNPFINDWKLHKFKEDSKFIASIPFVRNLVEYCGNINYYDVLTSCLHIKENTNKLNVGKIRTIFENVLNLTFSLDNEDKLIKNLVFEVCNDILSENITVSDLDKKITLSIGIRLQAELYLINKIKLFENIAKLYEICKEKNKSQTYFLYSKFCEYFPNNYNTKSILDKVNLIIPENIHVNSFMYEPILDMGCNSLKQLYKDVFELNKEQIKL